MVLLWILLVHGAVTWIWLGQDHHDLLSVPDEFKHVQGMADLEVRLQRDGLRGAVAGLFARNSHYPVWAHYPGALTDLLLGGSPRGERLASGVYVMILLVGLYRLGRAAHSPGAGLLAAALASLMPPLYGGWRTIGLDLPAMCLTPWALVLLWRSKQLTRLRQATLFGLACGLAAMMKPQALMFLVGPAAVALWRGLRASGPGRPARLRRRALLGAALTLAALLTVTAPYWAGRLPYIWSQAMVHLTGRGMLHYEGDISLLGGVVLYARTLPFVVTGPGVVAFLLLLPRFLRVARFRWEVVAWILVPLVLQVVLKVRHPRYLFPLMPAMALVVGVGLFSLAPRIRAAAVTALVGLMGTMWIACTLGVTPPSRGPHAVLPWAIRWVGTPPSSLLGYMCTCGSGQYAHPPSRPHAEPSFDAATRLAAWLDARHPGGRGVLLTHNGNTALTQLLETARELLPGLRVSTFENLATLRRTPRPEPWPYTYRVTPAGAPFPARLQVARILGVDPNAPELAGVGDWQGLRWLHLYRWPQGQGRSRPRDRPPEQTHMK